MTILEISEFYKVSDSTARRRLRGVEPKKFLKDATGHRIGDYLKGDVAKAFKASKK